MINKLHILSFIALLAAFPSIQAQPGEVHHLIFVWLKDPGNHRHRQRIIKHSYQLQQIPGVMDLTVGEVMHSQRKIVDDSYDIGISMRFASQQTMQAYLSHPDHVKVVKQILKPLVSKIRVYDFKEAAKP